VHDAVAQVGCGLLPLRRFRRSPALPPAVCERRDELTVDHVEQAPVSTKGLGYLGRVVVGLPSQQDGDGAYERLARDLGEDHRGGQVASHLECSPRVEVALPPDCERTAETVLLDPMLEFLKREGADDARRVWVGRVPVVEHRDDVRDPGVVCGDDPDLTVRVRVGVDAPGRRECHERTRDACVGEHAQSRTVGLSQAADDSVDLTDAGDYGVAARGAKVRVREFDLAQRVGGVSLRHGVDHGDGHGEAA